MRHIANTITVGAPYSPARYHAAQTNAGVPVCIKCLRAHSGRNHTIISIGKEDCYVCENATETYLILS